MKLNENYPALATWHNLDNKRRKAVADVVDQALDDVFPYGETFIGYVQDLLNDKVRERLSKKYFFCVWRPGFRGVWCYIIDVGPRQGECGRFKT